MNISSIIVTIAGWVLAKVFGLVRENQIEKKYVQSEKENLELRAENSGLRKRKEVREKEDDVKKQWEEADAEERYKILKRDFSNTD